MSSNMLVEVEDIWAILDLYPETAERIMKAPWRLEVIRRGARHGTADIFCGPELICRLTSVSQGFGRGHSAMHFLGPGARRDAIDGLLRIVAETARRARVLSGADPRAARKDPSLSEIEDALSRLGGGR